MTLKTISNKKLERILQEKGWKKVREDEFQKIIKKEYKTPKELLNIYINDFGFKETKKDFDVTKKVNYKILFKKYPSSEKPVTLIYVESKKSNAKISKSDIKIKPAVKKLNLIIPKDLPNFEILLIK